MSREFEKLGQILESTFGLAFLAQLLGQTAWERITQLESTSSISSKARTFRVSDLEQPVFEIYSDFIREYPFGYTHDWIRLAAELRESKSDLAHVLHEIRGQLLVRGFNSSFDHTKQFAVCADAYYQGENFRFETIWKSNTDVWWTHPNTVPSFQGNSPGLAEFAFDDAVISPTSMMKVSMEVAPKVYELHSALDWVSLVQQFPAEASVLHLDQWQLSFDKPVESVWIPDWRRVAVRYDGVYLSPAAYLGASYNLFSLPDGRVTFLSGWSPGATFWLPKS